MSHHRQMLPGWGRNSNTRLRLWEDGVPGSQILGPGYHYPLYPWKPRKVDETWKQDFENEPTPEQKRFIEDLENWWIMSPQTQIKNPDGTFEDMIATDMVAGAAGGRYRVKVNFELPSSVKNIKAIWAHSAIQKLAVRPIEINAFKGKC